MDAPEGYSSSLQDHVIQAPQNFHYDPSNCFHETSTNWQKKEVTQSMHMPAFYHR